MNEKLKQLINELRFAREVERNANKARLDVEQRIIAELGDQVPEKGTLTLGDLRIATGFTDKWCQESVQELLAENVLPFSPFNVEFKPDAKKMRTLEEIDQQAYRTVRSLCTSTPKKPSLTLKG
jgi:hypothetical protein